MELTSSEEIAKLEPTSSEADQAASSDPLKFEHQEESFSEPSEKSEDSEAGRVYNYNSEEGDPAMSARLIDPVDRDIVNILRCISIEDVLKASTIQLKDKSSAERFDNITIAVHCMCNGILFLFSSV